jgi:TRAP-type C4-dicarboxylate transport system permease small subunit
MTEQTQEQSNVGKGPLDHLAEFCKIVSLAGLVIITFVQAWQVFARYVLNNSPGWTEPVSVFFMALTVMMAAAVGVREGTHFSFSNILDGIPAQIRRFVQLFLNVLTFVVACALAYWGVDLVARNWDIVMAGAPLPAGVRYFPFSIGSVIMAIFAAERIFVHKKS